MPEINQDIPKFTSITAWLTAEAPKPAIVTVAADHASGLIPGQTIGTDFGEATIGDIRPTEAVALYLT